MIWYACKQCGKRHGRAENLSGTMVFCECGCGNRVPWSSSVPEPTPEESPAPIPLPLPPPPAPSGRPLPSIPLPPRRFDDDYDQPRHGRDDEPLPPFRSRSRRVGRRVNPKFCLNHDESASEHTCAQCHLPFCSKCVLTLQGETLCGPCKNFKVRGMQRPSRVSALATVAAVVAMVSGPVSFCLTMLGAGTQSQGGGVGAVLFSIVGLLPPVGALALSLWALNDIESKPRTSGRALAMTGFGAGLIGILWAATVTMLMLLKSIQAQ
jgi:hypothetical protein